MRLISTVIAFAGVLTACSASHLPSYSNQSLHDVVGAGNELIANSKTAIVTTQAGQVQGFSDSGILTFRGVKYAQAERFRPPQPVEPWEGNKTALSYGSICPQPISQVLREPQTFVSGMRFWPQSEDCQNLNVWTPALNDGEKRPVMVWLHGGGFFSGSSQENDIYDGRELSRKGDVVVVSINHRLNILGFLDLSDYGQEYKYSGNVGMLDIIEALRWVKANIEKFGGDPDNVTIFGQSGGGGKVATLLTAPSAASLYDKAIIQSGLSGLTASSGEGSQANARRVAELTFEHAGLQPGDILGMLDLPYEALQQAGGRALRQVSAELNPGRGGPLGFPSVNWGPVVDQDFLPENPFGVASPDASKGIPLMLGSTLNEFQLIGKENWRAWSETKADEEFNKRFGPDAQVVEQAFAEAYPDMSKAEWLTVDAGFRSGVLRGAAYKVAQGDNPFVYLFAWKSPVLDGSWASGHSMELAFVFNNVERGRQSTGGGSEVRQLTDLVSQAWINFARNGDPNGPGVPEWPAYSADTPATMVFDDSSYVEVEHDRSLIELLAGSRGR